MATLSQIPPASQQMPKGKFKVSIEYAAGMDSFEVDAWEWIDLQSSTYLKMTLSDKRVMMFNDFIIRKVLVESQK